MSKRLDPKEKARRARARARERDRARKAREKERARERARKAKERAKAREKARKAKERAKAREKARKAKERAKAREKARSRNPRRPSRKNRDGVVLPPPELEEAEEEEAEEEEAEEEEAEEEEAEEEEEEDEEPAEEDYGDPTVYQGQGEEGATDLPLKGGEWQIDDSGDAWAAGQAIADGARAPGLEKMVLKIEARFDVGGREVVKDIPPTTVDQGAQAIQAWIEKTAQRNGGRYVGASVAVAIKYKKGRK